MYKKMQIHFTCSLNSRKVVKYNYFQYNYLQWIKKSEAQ